MIAAVTAILGLAVLRAHPEIGRTGVHENVEVHSRSTNLYGSHISDIVGSGGNINQKFHLIRCDLLNLKTKRVLGSGIFGSGQASIQRGVDSGLRNPLANWRLNFISKCVVTAYLVLLDEFAAAPVAVEVRLAEASAVPSPLSPAPLLILSLPSLLPLSVEENKMLISINKKNRSHNSLPLRLRVLGLPPFASWVKASIISPSVRETSFNCDEPDVEEVESDLAWFPALVKGCVPPRLKRFSSTSRLPPNGLRPPGGINIRLCRFSRNSKSEGGDRPVIRA